MNTTAMFNALSRSVHKVGFTLKKHSPEILVVTGVVGTVVSAVMACKATTKIETILEEPRQRIADIHNYVEEKGYSEEYTEKDEQKDLMITYAQAGLKLVKLYGPSLIVGAASIGAILTSHKIMRGRNIALAAAYATVDRSFKDYRGRVIDRFGKELDRELKYDIKTKEVEETVVQEDGTAATVKKKVQVVENNMPSEYARFFDDGCAGWDKDAEYNLYFLHARQKEADDRLKRQGYLFLNDVYDMLGIPRTRAGQEVGWIYDEKNPIGDNYVDFGIYNTHNAKARDFVNGYERVILLDFNVDGPILHLMP